MKYLALAAFLAALAFIAWNVTHPQYVGGMELRPGMALTYDEFRSIE